MSLQDPSKLLIVDDLPENLRALDALIRGEGRLVYQASSGEEALALMLEHDFALAILDVQMPGMDGFELAEMMRSTSRTRAIPIVFVSAAGRELNYAFKGYETGAVDFLYKPLDSDAVRSKVNVFVTLDQQRRQMQRQMAAIERSRQEQETLLRELNQTQEELQRSLRMRDEFMSLVAHELRTPLNTLFLEAQMRSLQLKRGTLATIKPDQFEAMIKRDERQIKAMIRLIDDMLDVSRMRSGQLSIRPGQVQLMDLLERVVSDLSLQAAATGCKLSLQPHPPVEGCWDEFRIEQVVVNLLTNALRYGGGQPVEVSVQYAADTVRIDVRDEGKGIAQSDLERIFEPYERGARNGEPKGLGLGLYISRQLAISHGGELRVSSKPGEGSTFSLILPTCEQTVQAATTA
ncbi:hybrid sensor histidine kinase/response regulator [Massilia sp. LC238]|uniref:hybrid sensor histidine kinase/response regulator n=1 Tax=Massilia sp. LC238 TaxID=1502852 RepID=UPI0004E3060E|nr:hybrid sensor histidine kinase/response regulator [Massilia sp. LC238]KFC65996.1 Response regulator receiver sensor signal transduction histidine kinase [Massilia sp. LC238]